MYHFHPIAFVEQMKMIAGELDIKSGIEWLDSIAITMQERKEGDNFKVKYKNDVNSDTRTAITDKGEESLDCSELVCRYLQKIGWSKEVKWLTTALLYSYAQKHPDKLRINDDENYKPIKGDIFLWKSNSGRMGHTGVVVAYDQNTDTVTTIEAITGNTLANENSKGFQLINKSSYYRFNFGGTIKCVWKRKEYHLIGHKKVGYTNCRFYTPLKK